MDLDEVADELYGLEPGDFVPRRDERVSDLRRAGERDLATAVKALRRPTAAASVVNRLARQRPDEVGRLVELGARMRDAQASLAGDELRALGRQRQQLVVALGREAARLAAESGHPVSDAVEREVESTLDAALADPAAGAAVLTGRLLRALEHRGLEVDLEGALAGSRPAAEGSPASTRREPGPGRGKAGKARGPEDEEREQAEARRRALEAAEAEEQAARGRLQRAQAKLAEMEGAVEPAEQRAAEHRREVERLESELNAARRASDRAAQEAETAQRRRQDAAEEARAAGDEHAAALDQVRALQADRAG